MTTFADTGLRYSTPTTVNSRERIVRSETLNLKTQAVGNSSQRWDINVALEPAVEREVGMGRDLAVHKYTTGMSKSFTTKMPQLPGTHPENLGVEILTERADEFLDDDVDAHTWNPDTSYGVGEVVFFIESLIPDGDPNPLVSEGVFVALQPVVGRRPDISSSIQFWFQLYNDTTGIVSAGGAGDEWVTMLADGSVTVEKGRFIRFGNHSKIYQVLSEVNTIQDTAVAFKVFPPLIQAVDDEESILHEDPDITVFYGQDGQEGITYNEGIVVRANISLVEALA